MSAAEWRKRITDAIRAHSAGTARTAQASAGLIGASDVGWCRNYLRHLVVGTERALDLSLKWPAFVGTAVGDRLEMAMEADNPDLLTQVDLVCEFPSGKQIPGHADVVQPATEDDPGSVVDFKSKDGLALLENGDLDRGNAYQVIIYREALIQMGVLREGAKAYLAYVDRSGRDEIPVVREVTDVTLEEIDEWLSDVEYAVLADDEAPRDRPYNQCELVCPFFYACRGKDEHQDGGLIEEPELVFAAEEYRRALDMEGEAKRIKEDARQVLLGVRGSTGKVTVSWSHVNGGIVESFERKPSDRISVRRVK